MLFHTQLGVLERTLPSVLDGHAGGVHDARVATRRIRELLPLIHDSHRLTTMDDLTARFRRLGRSLGRVRDADVRMALLDSLQHRIPQAAPALVTLRQQCERERNTLIRKLIKRLERLDAPRLVHRLRQYRPGWRMLRSTALASQWRRDLRSILSARRRAAAEAIAHATGVYFPRRAHAARIALKKLRYALEIAHDTGRGDHSAAIRELKKAQDILGDLHDRQALIDDLDAVAEKPAQDASKDDEASALIRQVIDAEARHLHDQYLDRRDRLLAAVRGGANGAPISLSAPALLAVGGLALSTGALVARHRLRLGSARPS